MKIYVDDMIVKSIEEDRYIIDLKEAFGELRRYQMKLNSNKYTFGVGSDQFLDILSLIKEEQKLTLKRQNFIENEMPNFY